MHLVLDTNILIEIENNNKKIIEQLEQLKNMYPQNLSITIFNLCEFYYGAINKNEKHKHLILERLSQYNLFNTTSKTAIIFCELLSKLKTRGTIIPQFDLLIASLV